MMEQLTLHRPKGAAGRWTIDNLERPTTTHSQPARLKASGLLRALCDPRKAAQLQSTKPGAFCAPVHRCAERFFDAATASASSSLYSWLAEDRLPSGDCSCDVGAGDNPRRPELSIRFDGPPTANFPQVCCLCLESRRSPKSSQEA